jgi:hypothetical protein
MMRNRLFRLGTAVAAASVVLSLSACAPGPSGNTTAPSPTNEASKDISSAGPVTLTVWDQNTDGGIAKAQDQLNAQFHEVPQRHHPADRRIVQRSQDHPEAGPVEQHPTRRRAGQPGLPRHGCVRRGRDAASDERLRQALRLGRLLPGSATQAEQLQRRRQDLAG